MKKLGLLCTAALLTLSLAACSGNGGKQGGTDNNGGTANTGDKQLKVAIVLSTGGLGDKNFNDMSYDGLTQAKADFGIDFQYVEPESASDFEAGYRQFADAGVYDLIIGLATDQNDALRCV